MIMKSPFSKKCFSLLLAVYALIALASYTVFAQEEQSVYQRFAPIDLTGNWVSVITEDWHLRMISPEKGNFDGLPLTLRAQEIGNSVDLEEIENNGQACLAFGAGRVMREPGRIKISWLDSNILHIETDAGEQTRLLHFDHTARVGEASLQGHSLAQWQYANGFDPDQALLNPGEGRGRSLIGFIEPALEPSGGKLYVETNNLSGGMLRKNGVPYSSDAEIKEYFNTLKEPDGTEWLIVTTIVNDPLNLVVDHITSTNFVREADASKWDPRPCSLF